MFKFRFDTNNKNCLIKKKYVLKKKANFILNEEKNNNNNNKNLNISIIIIIIIIVVVKFLYY